MPGLGGGASRSAYPELVDTILYDTTSWLPSDGTTPVTVGGKGSGWSGAVPIRSRANARIEKLIPPRAANLIRPSDIKLAGHDGARRITQLQSPEEKLARSLSRSFVRFVATPITTPVSRRADC